VNNVAHEPKSRNSPSVPANIYASNEQQDDRGREMVLQSSGVPVSPPLKSRLRENKHVRPTTPAPASQNNGRAKSGRPVVFATQKPQPKAKATKVSHTSTSHQYTLQDLLLESQPGGSSVTPSVVFHQHMVMEVRLTSLLR